MQMSDNTILITGGTSGIGLGLAERFHAKGNKVIVAGRREALLDEITTEHDGIDSIVLDVTDPASIRGCFETVTSKYPQLNVLINNAGIMQPEDLTDTRHLNTAEATVATNLLAPIRMLAAFVPFLAGQTQAAVMNVSSGLAFVPLPITPTYNATKAAIHSYTEALRVQLTGTGIEVLELIPPAVQTDLMGQNDSDRAMPLQAFLDEVMEILQTQPDATQICVENVKPLRYAEATGTYNDILTMLSAH